MTRWSQETGLVTRVERLKPTRCGKPVVEGVEYRYSKVRQNGRGAMAGGGYTPRLADAVLGRLLDEIPAVLLVGPRAAGKTTTAGRLAAHVVRLDRPAEAAAFEADADAALRGLPEPVLLDEWQAVPGVLGAVKRAVDTDPRPGRFL